MTNASTRGPQAVLWDMDGTLIDSEPYWFAAERELVSQHGRGDWPDEYAHQLIGSDLLDAAAFLQQHGGVEMDAHDMVNWMITRVVEHLRDDAKFRPGALSLLNECVQAGLRCGLVTMSWKRLTEPLLGHLPETFEVVITGDAVPPGHGKPDAMPYTMGAQGLGLRGVDCVAIEDSPTGMTSAWAAGCAVLMVPNAHGVSTATPATVQRADSLEDVSVETLRQHWQATRDERLQQSG